ncbi:MAG TPA: periplasmic heavy metal sensor [Dongiaceae bacterium]|nr:periplasmic heavy metal sensor [Dongiaceae bacterium]
MTLTGRKGTIVVVALIVSICLNLAAAGLMIGHRWHDGPGRGGMWGAMRGVPEEAQPLVKQAFDANRPEFDAKRAAVDEARQRIATVLQADAIDQAALDAAIADMQARMSEMFQVGQKVMVDVAQKLPPEVRKEWAKKWAEERRWKKD